MTGSREESGTQAAAVAFSASRMAAAARFWNRSGASDTRRRRISRSATPSAIRPDVASIIGPPPRSAHSPTILNRKCRTRSELSSLDT